MPKKRIADSDTQQPSGQKSSTSCVKKESLMNLDQLSDQDLRKIDNKVSSKLLLTCKDDYLEKIFKYMQKLHATGMSTENLLKEIRHLSKRIKDPNYGNCDNRRKVAPIFYSDGQNEWSGRGKTPKWLTEKIEMGHSKETFLTNLGKEKIGSKK